MKNLIRAEIETLNKTIEECKEKLSANYIHNFGWGYPEKQLRAELKKVELEEFLSFIEESPERGKEWLDYNIQYKTRELLDGDYTNNSTNQFANIKFTAKKEVMAELLKLYTKWNSK